MVRSNFRPNGERGDVVDFDMSGKVLHEVLSGQSRGAGEALVRDRRRGDGRRPAGRADRADPDGQAPAHVHAPHRHRRLRDRDQRRQGRVHGQEVAAEVLPAVFGLSRRAEG